MIDKSLLSVSLDQAPETRRISAHSVLLPCSPFEMRLTLIKRLSIVCLARVKNLKKNIGGGWGVKWNIDSLFLRSWNGLTHGTCKIFMTLCCPKLCLHHSVEQAFHCTRQKSPNIWRPHLSQRARLWRLVKHSGWDRMSLAAGWKARTMWNLFKKLNVMSNNGRRFAQYFFTAKRFRLPQEEKRSFIQRCFPLLNMCWSLGCGMHLNQGRVTFR